jgi:hypothetical protein
MKKGRKSRYTVLLKSLINISLCLEAVLRPNFIVEVTDRAKKKEAKLLLKPVPEPQQTE